MGDLLLYLGLMAVGYFLGRGPVRKHRNYFGWTGKLQTVTVVFLVLTMGLRMGSNREIVDNLSTIGLSALLYTAFIFAACLLGLRITRSALGMDAHGMMKHQNQSASVSDREGNGETEKPGMNMMTLYILIAVAVGMALGFFVILKQVESGDWFGGEIRRFDDLAGLLIKLGLCVLLLFVGVDLGVEGTVFKSIKEAGLRILVFPLVTILATFIGAIICGLILGISVRESLAIGAGFGWYTLAPGIIMEAGYVSASAISFLHNVLRETCAILFLPLIAEKVGYVEAAAVPGAPAMDVCLPIVAKVTKPDIVIYALVTGLIMSLLVPILVPLVLAI